MRDEHNFCLKSLQAFGCFGNEVVIDLKWVKWNFISVILTVFFEKSPAKMILIFVQAFQFGWLPRQPKGRS